MRRHPLRRALVATLLAACNGQPGGGQGTSADTDGSSSGSAAGTASGADDTEDGSTLPGASESNEGGTATTSSVTDAASTTGSDTSSDAGDSSTGDPVEPVIHVHIAGMDSNPGTPEAPVRTIQHALELAIDQGVPNVHVAAGDYTASVSNEQTIDLPGGVSLFGGYAADDWSVNDPAAHVTRITGEDGYVVRIVGGERDDTWLDGFALVGNGAGPVVFVDGSPTIRRNLMTKLQTSTNAIGIEVDGGAPRISRNRIVVLDGNGTYVGAVGVRLFGDGGRLDANMIYAQGEGLFAETAGVAVLIGVDAPVQIHANSLRAGGGSSFAISGTLTSAEIVGNNLIATQTPSFTGCVDGGLSYPAALTHNNFDCPAFYTVPGQLPLQTIAALHAEIPGASDNVAVPLQYVDPLEADLHIVGTDMLLCEFAVGGTDLGAPVDRDYDDVLRTDPWTIGAVEVDTPCL